MSNMEEIEKKTQAASMLWNAQEVGVVDGYELVACEHQFGH